MCWSWVCGAVGVHEAGPGVGWSVAGGLGGDRRADRVEPVLPVVGGVGFVGGVQEAVPAGGAAAVLAA